MRLFLILSLLLLAIHAHGQDEPGDQVEPVIIPDSSFLYKPPVDYEDCTPAPQICFVEETVPNLLTQPHRDVLVRIRFPINAPPGRLPVILWSHGGDPRPDGIEDNLAWGRTMTRAGYIFIHMQHLPFTTPQFEAACVEFGAVNEAECRTMPPGPILRARDASVVLAGLNWLENRFGFLNGRIDYNNIAVGGWSGGSITSLALAGARYRLTAASSDVSFANPIPKVFLANSTQGPGFVGYKEDSWREIFRPVLTATGLSDSTPGTTSAERLIAYQSMPPSRKYQLYINDPRAIHKTFGLSNPDFQEGNIWVASYSVAYFDYYLKSRSVAGAFLISNRLPLKGSRKTAIISRK